MTYLFNLSKLNGRRSKLEIYVDALDAVVEKDKITHVMGKASLNSRQRERYFPEMEGQGLLASNCVNEKKKYEITERGRDIRKRIKELLYLLN